MRLKGSFWGLQTFTFGHKLFQTLYTLDVFVLDSQRSSTGDGCPLHFFQLLPLPLESLEPLGAHNAVHQLVSLLCPIRLLPDLFDNIFF